MHGWDVEQDQVGRGRGDEDEGRIQGKKANMGKRGPLEEYKVLLTEFWMTKHLTN